ncbi:hypothetical protein MRX96_026878 [Rhipicephalus microplus]
MDAALPSPRRRQRSGLLEAATALGDEEQVCLPRIDSVPLAPKKPRGGWCPLVAAIAGRLPRRALRSRRSPGLLPESLRLSFITTAKRPRVGGGGVVGWRRRGSHHRRHRGYRRASGASGHERSHGVRGRECVSPFRSSSPLHPPTPTMAFV